jgi:NADP-dependent 3-hydroxy acid dehydrogenase YdfG
VNNAGISIHGPLEYLPVDELRRHFDVNVTGQLAVTQAFLP